MHDSDSQSDPGSAHRSLTTSRRRFLSAAAVGGVSLSGMLGTADSQQVTQIRLGARIRGWIGVTPPGIEGVTNPLLTLRPEQRYEVTIENLDGITHNFVVQDGESRSVVDSADVSERGETVTVEFTASEDMASYVCQYHPSSMRGVIQVASGTPTLTRTRTSTPTATRTQSPTETATGTDTPTETTAETPTETETETESETDTEAETETEEPTEEPDPPSFEQDRIEVVQGNEATITVDLGGREELALRIGSESVNYVVEFTAVDGDGDGQVTVVFDTFVAGRGTDPSLSAASADDEIRDTTQVTDQLSAPLDFAPYPIQALAGEQVAASSLLVLRPRSLSGTSAAVAPQGASPAATTEFSDRVTRQGTVASGDWALLDVEMAGLYASLDGVAALEDDALGYDLVIEEAGVVNAEPYRVPVSNLTLLTFPDDDRFLAAVDSATLDVNSTYNASFTITDANPYVPDDSEERVETEFEVVERTASVDVDGSELSVPPQSATLSGTTTVAPGTELTVSVSGSAETGFQQIERPVVQGDGTWSATFDFSTLDAGTQISVNVLELGPVVQGRVTAE